MTLQPVRATPLAIALIALSLMASVELSRAQSVEADHAETAKLNREILDSNAKVDQHYATQQRRYLKQRAEYERQQRMYEERLDKFQTNRMGYQEKKRQFERMNNGNPE